MDKKIVLFGDSMIDTFDFMGSGFLELKQELARLDPNSNFQLINHGVGSTDVELGLKRVSTPYVYQARERNLPSVLEENPNIVVIESFAYNHWTDSDKDQKKYIDIHKEIISQIQTNSKAIILLLASISPNKDRYAKGVTSLGWTNEKQHQEYELVIRYLTAFVDFAKSTGLPFLNLFEESLSGNTTGNLNYISNVDYIHLSYDGRILITQKLAPKLIELLK